MVLWDPSESPAAIALNPHLHTRGRPHYSVRTWSAAELANPTTYILLATGLAKRVRAHREAARLALAQLANFCDVEPTQLSRLEAALPGWR